MQWWRTRTLGERAVLHCWTGGSKWTKRFDQLGVTFSLAGPLTYKTGRPFSTQPGSFLGIARWSRPTVRTSRLSHFAGHQMNRHL